MHGYSFDELQLPCTDENLPFNFSRTKFATIGENFIDSPLVTCLTFNNTELREIESGAFARLPNLIRLYISNTSLEYTHKFLFSLGKVSALQFLVLDNAFSSVPENDFVFMNKYPELRYLSLRNNMIRSFNRDGSVKRLYYEYDYREVSEETVDTFPKLEYLDLSGNRIESIHNVKLPKTLMYLKMSDNNIRFFKGEDLTNLEVLILDSNSFTSIATSEFNYYSNALYVNTFSNVRHLSVRNNQLKDVDPEALSSMTKLEYLDLSGNNLNNLRLSIFDKMESLKVLKLSCFSSPIFLNINTELKIEELDLGSGKLEWLGHEVFNNLPRLKKLYLDNNHIKTIDRTAFLALSELEILHLEGNRLSYMEDGWSESLKMLRYLNLSGNRFISLSSLRLTNTEHLMDIYLAQNALQLLNVDAFRNLSQNVTVHLVESSDHRKECEYPQEFNSEKFRFIL